MSRKLRHVLKGLGTGLAVALILLLLRGTYAFEALELKTLDLRFRALHQPGSADTTIVIVDQDQASVDMLRDALGRPPWPRRIWAGMVDYLAQAGARVIAFDYTFADPVLADTAGDVAFAEASARAGTVVQTISLQPIRDSALLATTRAREDPALLAQLPRFSRNVPGMPGPEFQAVEHPYAALLGASYALGVINYTPDEVDGTARRSPPLFHFRGYSYPALGLAVALAADSSLSIGDIPLDRGAMLLNWQGPYRDLEREGHPLTYRTISAGEILYQWQSGDTTTLPPSVFRGKVVFLGASASGLFETRATPFGSAEPGVIVHVTMADNLLNRAFLRRASLPANAALIVLAAVLTGLAVAMIPQASLSGAASGGLAALVIAACFWLFGARGLWLDASTPVLAILLTYTGGMAVNYVTEGRQKRQIRDMFSKYVAPEYVAQLAEDPSRLHLEGRRAELSILFSDIRGFTTISESMSPTEVIGFLNVYLSQMAQIVKDAGGTLDKFIGDAVMAFWGEPVPLADHADRACDCALAMKDATEKLAAQFAAEGKPPIRIGIGINTADVVVGNIGSLEHKLDYTVIGDGVNLASRLEGLNKDHGTTIIISEFTHARLNGRFAARALGEVKVKGKTKPVGIYELLGRAGGEAG